MLRLFTEQESNERAFTALTRFLDLLDDTPPGGRADLDPLGLSFQAYTDQFKAYPFRSPGTPPDDSGDLPPLPGDLLAVRWWPEGTIVATSSAWALGHLWPGVLSAVAPLPQFSPARVSPRRAGSGKWGHGHL